MDGQPTRQIQFVRDSSQPSQPPHLIARLMALATPSFVTPPFTLGIIPATQIKVDHASSSDEPLDAMQKNHEDILADLPGDVQEAIVRTIIMNPAVHWGAKSEDCSRSFEM